MAVSRRAFFRTLGVGGAGVLSSRFFTRNELMLLAQGQDQSRYDPSYIVISSNENPRGPATRHSRRCVDA